MEDDIDQTSDNNRISPTKRKSRIREKSVFATQAYRPSATEVTAVIKKASVTIYPQPDMKIEAEQRTNCHAFYECKQIEQEQIDARLLNHGLQRK